MYVPAYAYCLFEAVIVDISGRTRDICFEGSALDGVDCRSYLDPEETAVVIGEVECHVTWADGVWEDFID